MRAALVHAAVLAGLAACCTGCTPSPASVPAVATDGLVVVQSPPGVARAQPERFDLDARYPLGSRVIVVRPGRGPAEERFVLSRGFASAGAPAVSPDGSTVLFAGLRTPESPWAIYETRSRGSRPRKLLELNRDCGDPAYLAGDRVVIACAAEGEPHWSLYTVFADGTGIERITFGVDSAFDPHPLRDGRILFSMQQGPGVGRPDRSAALFTINPDGSMFEPFSGSHTAPASRSRARETSDGGVLFIATDPDGAARLRRVELSRPLATEQTLSFMLDRVVSAEPLAGDALLLTGRPASDTDSVPTSAVFWTVPGSSDLQPVFDDPEWDDVEAVSLSPTTAPRGKPSGLRSDQRSGRLIVYDANRSDGVVGPPRGGSRPVSLTLQTISSGKPRTLGNLPIEEDGSLFVEVPADRPIRVRTLDASGAEISTSEWFWVRGGETRACFGCHESRESAPVNRVVRSIGRKPLSLQPTTHGVTAR